MRLQGKTAPIARGSSIELATARLFAAEGASVPADYFYSK